MGDLTRNFSSTEFTCRCCGKGTVNMKLVKILQGIRDKVGPMIVDSGYRCEEHNEDVGGKLLSAHLGKNGSLIAEAVDIDCQSSGYRHKIMKAASEAGIERIGVTGEFIHLDISNTLPRTKFWLYTYESQS